MKTKTGLLQKIFRITQEAKNIELGGRNESEGYAFSRIGDVMDSVDGLLEKYRLILTGEVCTGGAVHFPTAKGCITDVICDWVLEDVDTGEKRHWCIPGSGWGDDKATYKALTGSRKYAYIFIFNLRLGDEPETWSQVDTEDAKEKAQKVGDEKAEALKAARKAAKECVTVTWPEAHNGHRALFTGKTSIMEHNAWIYMQGAGNWVERELGWFVDRDAVKETVTQLEAKGCKVIMSVGGYELEAKGFGGYVDAPKQ
jgi:ERF superfamily